MSSLPAGCVVRYRICTEKSILGFGKYADLRVGDIMKVDDKYIPWVYFNKAGISFHADILERYGLPPIEKPGADPDAFYKWDRERWNAVKETLTEEQRMHAAMNRKRGKQAAAVARLVRAEKAARYSKAELQAINHGHKKSR